MWLKARKSFQSTYIRLLDQHKIDSSDYHTLTEVLDLSRAPLRTHIIKTLEDMQHQSPLLELPGSKNSIPQVGFGLWKVSPESAADTVYEVYHITLLFSRCDTNKISKFRLLRSATDYLMGRTITAMRKKRDREFSGRSAKAS